MVIVLSRRGDQQKCTCIVLLGIMILNLAAYSDGWGYFLHLTFIKKGSAIFTVPLCFKNGDRFMNLQHLFIAIASQRVNSTGLYYQKRI